MSKAKALVILSPGFPANEADSTCLPLQQILVKTLKEMNPGLNIIVLAFQYPFKSARYQFHGVDVIAFGGKSRGGIFRVLNWLRIWLTLRKLNKQYQLIGLLSFWLGECAFISNKFAKWNRLKHFCWILGQDAKPGNKYIKWTKPTANSLIALSDFLAAEFSKNYDIMPLHLIPPGIDTTLYKSSVVIERDIDILGAGSLIPLKQYDLFINIINLLRKYSPDIKAVICGQGPEGERLKAMIKVLDLEKNIELTGELPHSSVLELMQRSKVFLHTSAYEGFVVVCLEALYAGAQVVSMVRPMNAPIENWYIIQNQVDMAHKIKELLDDPAIDYKSVLPYAIQDTANAMMQLFDQSDSAIA
ncbi:MAG TPA: glycosyltransferase [Mucilaginibacter sp.]|nr:glycosyltransferase [Mucilaginibacter sp.]